MKFRFKTKSDHKRFQNGVYTIRKPELSETVTQIGYWLVDKTSPYPQYEIYT